MAFSPKTQQVLTAIGMGLQGKGAEFAQGLDDNRKQALLEDAFTVQQQLTAGNVPAARQTLLNRLQAIEQLGGDPADTDSILLDLERGNVGEALQRVNTVVEFGFASGRLKRDPATSQGTPAEQQAFEALIANFSPEDQVSARRIRAGVDPRAVGSAVQTITTEGTATDVADTEKTLAAGRETGKLIAQFELKPRVEAAVTTAVANATLLADQAILDKTNASAFKVYDIGMQALVSGLDNTLAGPIVGFLPALTANAQISDAALAAMLPVVKQLFRASGEGIFTDKDQELLEGMLPNRKMLPEARASAMFNVDAIIRAKLGQPLVTETAGQTPGASGDILIFDAQGNPVP